MTGRLLRAGTRGLHGTGVIGYLCVGVIVVAGVIAVFGPALAPHDPNAVNLSELFCKPSSTHLLGCDSNGRDLFSRILVGARTSILGPAAVVTIAVLVGMLLAVATAWIGGWFDSVASSILDVLFAFPAILLAVLAAAVFGASLTAAAIALAIAYTPYVARVLRGAALRERSQAYVAALEVQGFSGMAICVRHLIPNILKLIVAQGTVLFGYAMVDLAAISFIGLGVQPPRADWGVMVSGGENGVLQGHPGESLSAGIAIMIVVIAVNLLGERLIDTAQRGR
jgi:peptide/nickel transport system permease protein